MKILIYDNQFAYYELIKTSFPQGYEFHLFNAEENNSVDTEYDMLMFFLHDELEMLRFMKLYKQDIPVMLGLSSMNKVNDIMTEGNIYYLHLDKFKEEIVEDIKKLLQKVSGQIKNPA
jgi:hypothetical protein